MREHRIDNLPAGVSRVVHAAGSEFIYIKKAPYDLLLIVDGGDAIQVPEGAEIVRPVSLEFSIESLGTGNGDFTIITGVGSYKQPQITGSINVLSNVMVKGLPVLVFDTNQKTIPENLNRKEIHIEASALNAGVIWIGATQTNVGKPLKAGDIASLDVYSSVDLFSDNLNDKIYLLEIL